MQASASVDGSGTIVAPIVPANWPVKSAIVVLPVLNPGVTLENARVIDVGTVYGAESLVSMNVCGGDVADKVICAPPSTPYNMPGWATSVNVAVR